jgi:hypothetical protein
MFAKTLGFWALAGALLAACVGDQIVRRRLWADDGALLGLCGAFVALVVMGPAALQDGAAENYFFPLALHLALLSGAALRLTAHSWVAGAGALGWLASAGLVGLALAGLLGATDLRPMHRGIMMAKACLDPLPRPLFVDNPYLSLPWMNPGEEHYVLSFQYRRERAMGKQFAGNGIGGLIERGHFASLAVWSSDPVIVLDGTQPSQYVETGRCEGARIFLRRDLAEKGPTR